MDKRQMSFNEIRPPVLHQQLHHYGDLDGAHDHVRYAQGGQDAHIHASSW